MYFRIIPLITAHILWFFIARAQPAPTAWVINSLGETLSKVDLSSGQVVTNALTLGSAPNDIIIRGTAAYVVNSLSNHVQILDLSVPQTVSTIEIYQGLNPWAIAIDNRGCGFVTNYLTGNVSVLDLESGVETAVLTVGGALEGVCIFEDRLFVTDVNWQGPWTFGPGILHAFLLQDTAYLGDVEVGINPQVVKPGPDGMLHVVCTGDYNDIPGQVDLVDPVALSVVQTIPIGGAPGSLAFSSEGIAYLGGGGWGGNGAVLVYDALTHQIIRDAQNPILVPSAAMGIAATASDQVLVCCFPTDQLVELDGEGNLLRTFTVGDGPVALAIWEETPAVEPSESSVVSYSISWNFPEPFNTATTIVFNLKTPLPVTLKVFELSGRLVESRYLGVRSCGVNRTSFVPDHGMNSGMYWYQLQAGENLICGRMVYLK